MHFAGPQADKFAGGHRIRVPPVPIPNTEVKPDTADGTIWETVWESRSLPALLQTKRPDAHRSCIGSFCLYDGHGVPYLGSSEIGYSPRVRGLRGAGSRSALPLRFSVIFEYGGLIP